ncbi:TetR/AcrR family transcriptional regulator [Paenibacillus sp. 22594]|uniref:TetR/AcrR family transcriptional regulator n=1 Tax=Paenibacillus sp. 22594 TaxID=3453947 RepID=UPI003F83697F
MVRIKGRSDGEETKKRIVQKAAQLFVQKGYGAVTMNEVCSAAKVSKGSLYHHFPSKDELFLYIVEDDTEQWLLQWTQKKSSISGFEERFYALGEHYANDYQNPLIRALEEYARSRALSGDVQERLARLYESGSEACRNLLQEGMDSGYLVRGDLDNYVIVVSGLLEGIGRVSEIMTVVHAPNDIMKYYREAIALLLQGMRVR